MKTKLLCLILVQAILMGIFSGCVNTAKHESHNITVSSDAVIHENTPEPTPTPYVPYTTAYADLPEKYTLRYPDYEVQVRESPKPVSKVIPARYELDEMGWYNNPNAEETGSAVLMLTGDLMCQTRQQEAALEKYGEYKFNDNFYVVKDVFAEADFVVGNLEATLSAQAPYMSEQKEVDGKPHCNAPSTYAGALRYAGFDAVMTANNHCIDAGVYGLLDTIDVLHNYELMHTGTFASEKDQRVLLVNINGVRVAFLSYATYFNTKDAYLTDEGREILLNKYTPEKVALDVKAAKLMGAEFIIAYNHWGKEYTNTESEKQLRYAREMADAGVDYIIGSHPHALQRYDILTASDGRSVPVVYSMGNFVSHMTKTVAKDTIILRIELTKTEDGVQIASEGYIPCRVFKSYVGYNYIVMPISQEYNGGRSSRYFEAALKRITAVMGDKLEQLG